MVRDAGRSLAAQSARADEGWRRCSGAAATKNFFDAPLGHGPFGVATGAAPAGAGLPPANFLRGSSGTNSKAVATLLWWSAGGQGIRKTLAAHEDFPWHERSAPTSPSSSPLPQIPLPNSAVLMKMLRPTRHAGSRPCDCGWPFQLLLRALRSSALCGVLRHATTHWALPQNTAVIGTPPLSGRLHRTPPRLKRRRGETRKPLTPPGHAHPSVRHPGKQLPALPPVGRNARCTLSSRV